MLTDLNKLIRLLMDKQAKSQHNWFSQWYRILEHISPALLSRNWILYDPQMARDNQPPQLAS